MIELPDLRAGVYRHYKGPLYQVFGYGHDANADTLYDQQAVDDAASAWQSGVMHTVQPLTERICVVYMSLELTDAHTGPRLAFRNVEGEDAFFDRVHMGQPDRFTEGTVCKGSCWNQALNQDGLNNHLTVPRFEYLSPSWEGQR